MALSTDQALTADQLGGLFDSVGRKPMIAGTYILSGVLLLVTGYMFEQHLLTAGTLTLCWAVVFFFASAGVSAAYLTVSEVFPLENTSTVYCPFLRRWNWDRRHHRPPTLRTDDRNREGIRGLQSSLDRRDPDDHRRPRRTDVWRHGRAPGPGTNRKATNGGHEWHEPCKIAPRGCGIGWAESSSGHGALTEAVHITRVAPGEHVGIHPYMVRVKMDWSIAPVEGSDPRVALDGDLSTVWKRICEPTLRLLGSGDWRKVRLRESEIRVSDVTPGSEEHLRHDLEAIVGQANADELADEREPRVHDH
jgi:hypothetical protein